MPITKSVNQCSNFPQKAGEVSTTKISNVKSGEAEKVLTTKALKLKLFPRLHM